MNIAIPNVPQQKKTFCKCKKKTKKKPAIDILSRIFLYPMNEAIVQKLYTLIVKCLYSEFAFFILDVQWVCSVVGYMNGVIIRSWNPLTPDGEVVT